MIEVVREDARRLVNQARRIRQRWSHARNLSDSETPGAQSISSGVATYSGSGVTNTTCDFLGDWRAADTWQRFDLWRTRMRSRQLQRGNYMCRNFARTMCHFVLGSAGFHCKVNAVTMSSLGDATDGQPDKMANAAIKAVMEKIGLPQNFETRKRLSRLQFDRLLLIKLIFDGEVIIQKWKGFDNEFGFAWHMIDPDYLDHNLNRIEPNGNITKMGVELDKDFKFPVAYHFLTRRPNDYFYNYAQHQQERYYRVEAKDIIHLYVQDEDSEQTRGWPWIFAGMVNLWRADKFQEAALVNAQVGASKGMFYEKKYPEGFEGDPEDMNDQGELIDRVSPGMAVELPVGVTAKVIDTRYPDAELAPFLQAMSLGMALTFGMSYATTTGDLAQANFVSSKLGVEAENALYWSTQQLLIDGWKKPGFDEELFRAINARKVALPIAKFEKFNQPIFTGYRRAGIQPLEEAKANECNLNNRLDSPQAIVERRNGDWDALLDQIEENEKELEKRGIGRVVGTGPSIPDDENGEGGKTADDKKTKKKKRSGDGSLETAEDVIEFYDANDPMKKEFANVMDAP